ncbi:nitrate reductase cytochrome c-type subunit [Salipiger mangrovisoli]|uniref:Periplasmic nitrate reductase, electron transfer subunit n=1 Tax=Salipiger mangrovisoli TaxID=2865933 RepID=A0ABR9X3X3_9RHOB|nr:nitrate reductase cytochrome c-type subunit [Salipiger mangrovisoli]MBE9638295.1 nitrate reductase cytochrome c-type subunit [Salipiger mangrovisoli]
MRQLATTLGLVVALVGGMALAQSVREPVSELTGPSPNPMEPVAAAPLERMVTDDVRLMRAYPEQPPIIPHSIEGYELSVNANRCLSCHKRETSLGTGAPMISITHYMTRDAQMLADVSPRRYFCTQCHVPQADTAALIGNSFTDMAEMGATGAGSE